MPNSKSKQVLNPPGALIHYYPHFFDKDMAEEFMTELMRQVQWKQETPRIFGKLVNLPRLTAYYGDKGTGYKYSGIVNEPLPWIPVLDRINEAIEEFSEVSFNSVLLNQYRDGSDNVSWHADDEPEYGTEIEIGSVNLGASRDFLLKHQTDKSIDKIKLHLQHGSFLLMKHPTQLNWHHSVPKRAGVTEVRINLTFRRIVNI